MLKRIHGQNLYFRGHEVYRIYKGSKPVLDVFNARDFIYSYDYMHNNTCDIFDWKQTLNGVSNMTHLIVPDDPVLGIYGTDFAKEYSNQITHIVVPRNVSCYFGSGLSGHFANDTCLEYVDISGSYQRYYSNTFKNCVNLKTVILGDTRNDYMVLDNTFNNCTNLTAAVCPSQVTSMTDTYYNCSKLTEAVCGPNVTGMNNCYAQCPNIKGDTYFYSNNVRYASRCFYGRDVSKRLNIHVPQNSTTLNTCLKTNSYESLTGQAMTWSEDITNHCYYNTQYNLYVYPTANMKEVYESHLNK